MTEPANKGEVLDLRELILILWRKRWVILGFMLLIGLLAFVISSYLIPPQYRATALITITDRPTWTALELKGAPQLAESDDLRDQTFEMMGISDLVSQQSFSLFAAMRVRSQLQLQVTAKQPDLAADAANAWASLVAEKLYLLYGTSEESLLSLEEQVSQARDRYESAQEDLEDFIAGSELNVYPAELSAAQGTLENVLLEVGDNELLLSDLLVLEAQMENLSANGTLPVGLSISLISLQAQTFSGRQILPPLEEGETTITQAEGLELLQQLQSVITGQVLLLEEQASELDQKIADISRNLEMERDLEDQLRMERNLAQGSYESLEAELEQSASLHFEEQSKVVISARALPPQDSITPNVMTSTVFATATGLVLSTLGVLIQNWWVKKGVEPEEKKEIQDT